MLRANKVLLLLVNQVRSKIGIMYGDPTTKSGGGKSLDFYCTVSMRVKSNKTSDVLRDENKKALGVRGRLENTKNKCAIPFQECEFELVWNTGLNPYYGLEQVAIDAGLLEKKGGWYSTNTGEKFQGEDKLQEYLKSNPAITKYLQEN